MSTRTPAPRYRSGTRINSGGRRSPTKLRWPGTAFHPPNAPTAARGDPAGRPDDYKLWVYQGRVHYVNWIRGRGSSGYGGRVMDRDWNEAFTNGSVPVSPDLPVRPESLDTMIWMAERLAQDFSFARVDLYEIDGQPFFGELTFYPMSGNLPLHPTDADRELGRLWRRPRTPRFPAAPVPDLVAGAAHEPVAVDATRVTVGGRP